MHRNVWHEFEEWFARYMNIAQKLQRLFPKWLNSGQNTITSIKTKNRCRISHITVNNTKQHHAIFLMVIYNYKTLIFSLIDWLLHSFVNLDKLCKMSIRKQNIYGNFLHLINLSLLVINVSFKKSFQHKFFSQKQSKYFSKNKIKP